MRQKQSGAFTGAGACDKADFPSSNTSALTVADIMQYGVVTIRPETPAFEAVSVLVAGNVSSLPVVDDGRLVGMISEKDILKMVVGPRSLSEVVAEVNRYRRGSVILTNATLGRERLNARFKIANIDRVISQIEQVFGARTRALPGGIILLG